MYGKILGRDTSMEEKCPYCSELDKLIEYDGEEICFECAEHFRNEETWYEDAVRHQEE